MAGRIRRAFIRREGTLRCHRIHLPSKRATSNATTDPAIGTNVGHDGLSCRAAGDCRGMNPPSHPVKPDESGCVLHKNAHIARPLTDDTSKSTPPGNVPKMRYHRAKNR